MELTTLMLGMHNMPKILKCFALFVLSCIPHIAFAQSHESTQNVGSVQKICADLGAFLGHACSPEIHILASVSERVEFMPDPAAQVRVQMSSPVQFDTGWQGIQDGKLCQGVPGVSFFGQGVVDCVQVNHIVSTSDSISFHYAKSIGIGFSFPVLGVRRQEFTYFDKNVSMTR